MSATDGNHPLLGEEEHEGEAGHQLSSPSTALSNTCKAIIGSGCIALSDAFRQSGWVVGVVGLFGMAFISELTMRQLVLCNQAVRKRKKQDRKREGIEGSSSHDEECTFTDIGRISYGKWGAGAADFTMLTCQFGACCAALAFIAQGLGDVIDGTDPTRLIVLMVSGVVALGLTLLRSTAMLEHTSGLGNAIFLVSIVMVVYIGSSGTGARDCIPQAVLDTSLVNQCLNVTGPPPAACPTGIHCNAGFYDNTTGIYKPPSSGDGAKPTLAGRVGATDIAGFAQFFGVALYMFSAHSEVMAIEQFVADKEGFPKVLRKAVAIACVVYTFFGLFGYFTWGAATGFPDHGDPSDIGKHIGDIFQNIGSSRLADAVRALMCFMIMCNYPLMAFGAVQDLEHHLLPNETATMGSWVAGKRMVLRTIWVVASCLVVIATNFKFAFLVAFTGNFSNCVMAFTLPPIFYLELYPEKKEDPLTFYGNWALSISTFIIAMVFTVIGVMAL